ncbi:MAG: hypothetical protein ACI8ZM_002127 [Crocinitomix sp.]
MGNYKHKKKKNSLFVEFYSPIQTPSLSLFYNDNWVLQQWHESTVKRRYFSNAVGIGYERVFNNNLIIRPRIGLTFRNIFESTYLNTYDNGYKNVAYAEYTYTQRHINIFLGLAKRIKLHERVNLDLGFELSQVTYLDAENNYYSKTDHFQRYVSTAHQTSEVIGSIELGKAFIFGIGPYIKPEYHFNDKLLISMEMQIYFSMSYSKAAHRVDGKSVQTVYPAVEGSPFEYPIPDQDFEIDLLQWNWTKISPLIRLGYKF